jgi:anhydro-N-acetylmuramic acid kinase
VISDTPRTGVLVGLMSGTSLDGISATVARFTERDDGPLAAEVLGFIVREYTAAQRTRLAAATHGVSPDEYCRLAFDLGAWFADAACDVLADAGVARADVEAIASHGQTIWHAPPHATWQLGEAAVIAERTGLPVISDFRTRDVAAGGQGAPLVAISDAMLFAPATGFRALQNLGGIGNVTVVPPNGELAAVRAFDTGPGMMVIDAIARRLGSGLTFDRDAVLSRDGTPIGAAVTEILAEPYFGAEPPKTTGRELFGDAFVYRLIARCREIAPGATAADIAATAVLLTARSIVDAYSRFVPEPLSDVLLCGGGARHPLLAGMLAEQLYPCDVRSFGDVYFDVEAKEAVAFALLGYLFLRGRPGNVPTVTGARGPRVLGRWSPP